jgi:hypothetical protein
MGRNGKRLGLFYLNFLKKIDAGESKLISLGAIDYPLTTTSAAAS